MESSQTQTQQQSTAEASQLCPSNETLITYRVEYTWYNFKCRIYDDNKTGAEPLYIADFAKLRKPHAIYKRADNDQVIGTGTLHFFNIDADYEIHGRRDTMVAQKRFSTVYTHRSFAMSDTDQPMTMTWTSDSGFKTWDFVCVDENQLPVARFSANFWRMVKVGKIEFMGPKADSQALREELIVAGITLVYHMMVRMNNLLGLVGALCSSPGHDKKCD
ncbi:hypothetical protein PHISP_00867 [Aspergillus sp. HF37]|nr:hypothetical protein PHISP_00867 [Aspergillus sp. HF37]